MIIFHVIQFLILFSISPIYALDCHKELEFEYLESGKQVKEKKEFCILNEKKSFITSNCLKDCDLIKAHSQNISLPAGYGTPSHIECRKFGGLPMILKFTDRTIETKFVLCKFKDGSMSTTDLLGKWK